MTWASNFGSCSKRRRQHRRRSPINDAANVPRPRFAFFPTRERRSRNRAAAPTRPPDPAGWQPANRRSTGRSPVDRPAAPGRFGSLEVKRSLQVSAAEETRSTDAYCPFCRHRPGSAAIDQFHESWCAIESEHPGDGNADASRHRQESFSMGNRRRLRPPNWRRACLRPRRLTSTPMTAIESPCVSRGSLGLDKISEIRAWDVSR